MISELAKDKLKKLAYDEGQMNAIKDVLKEVLNIENILNEVDENLPNELVGQKIRAIKIASNMIDDAFKEIEDYKENSKEVEDNLQEEIM